MLPRETTMVSIAQICQQVKCCVPSSCGDGILRYIRTCNFADSE